LDRGAAEINRSFAGFERLEGFGGSRTCVV